MQRLLFGKKREDDSYSAMPDPNKLKKEIEAARKLAEDNARKAAEAKAKEEEIERKKQEEDNNGCTEEELVAASLAETNWWKGHFNALPPEERIFLKLGREGLMTDTAEIAKSTEIILSQGARDAMIEQKKLAIERERRRKAEKKRLFIESLVEAGLLDATVVASKPVDQAIPESEPEPEPGQDSPTSSIRYRSLNA